MSDQIQASHILISTTSHGSKEDSKEMIENVKSQLDAGANFADLAKEHSDCPSGQRGGDLGLFGRGAMVPTFDEAAFKLELNEVSSVIETEFGFHLIIRTA